MPFHEQSQDEKYQHDEYKLVLDALEQALALNAQRALFLGREP